MLKEPHHHIQKLLNNTKHLALQKKVKELDLEPIKFKLIKEKGWSLEQAERVEPLYKGYLFLYVIMPDETHIPSLEIDEMWHAHILDTEKYMVDCYHIFGYYLHHFPYLGLRGEEDKKNLDDNFERTRLLFQELMGSDPLDGLEATGCGGGGCGGGGCSSGGDSGGDSSTPDVGGDFDDGAAIIPASCSSNSERKKKDEPKEKPPTNKPLWKRILGMESWTDSVNPETMNIKGRPGKQETLDLVYEQKNVIDTESKSIN